MSIPAAATFATGCYGLLGSYPPPPAQVSCQLGRSSVDKTDRPPAPPPGAPGAVIESSAPLVVPGTAPASRRHADRRPMGRLHRSRALVACVQSASAKLKQIRDGSIYAADGIKDVRETLERAYRLTCDVQEQIRNRTGTVNFGTGRQQTVKTFNLIVAFVLFVAFGFVVGCSDDSSPTAPSATPMADASSYVPTTPVRATPASYDANVRMVAPGDERYGPNAYDFFAHWDAGTLRVALQVDEMPRMRPASQPHRMRQVEVYHVTSEPHHVGQVNGPPLFSGSVQLSGRLELPPIDLEGCASDEWLVVMAAELSDDRYDGWRNAPCPRPDGEVSGSDGTGSGWAGARHGPPSKDFPPEPEPTPEPTPTPTPTPEPTPTPTPEPTPAPAPVSAHAQAVIDREIEDNPLRQRGDSVQFPVRNLFQNPVGTNSYHFPVWSSDESVATARIVTDNPEIRITVTGFGTTTISVSDTRADVSISFVVSVMPEPEPEPTPTTTPMPEPEPTPEPTPEPEPTPPTTPMPEPTGRPDFPTYDLPFRITDERGDMLVSARNYRRPEDNSTDAFHNQFDVIRCSMSAPSADGWITVEITTAGIVDLVSWPASQPDQLRDLEIELDVYPGPNAQGVDRLWEAGIIAYELEGWEVDRAATFVNPPEIEVNPELTRTDTFSFRFRYPPPVQGSAGVHTVELTLSHAFLFPHSDGNPLRREFDFGIDHCGEAPRFNVRFP